MRIKCEYDDRDSIEVVDEGTHLRITVENDGYGCSVMLNEEKVKLLFAEMNKWTEVKESQKVSNED